MNVSKIQIKSLQSIQEKMDILSVLQNHAKDVREIKRLMDRAMEKYDACVSKASSFSKSKDNGQFSELGFATKEAKKHYIAMAFEFLTRVSLMKNFVDEAISEKLLWSLMDIAAQFDECRQIVLGLINATKQFHNPQIEQENLEEIHLNHSKWKELALSGDKQDPNPNDSFDVEGYLSIRKRDQIWSRRYFTLKGATLTFSNTSKLSSTPIFVPSVDISTAAFEINSTEDRRFVFDIILEKDTLTLQAESENDLKTWMDQLEGAKNCKRESLTVRREANDPSSGGPNSIVIPTDLRESKITISDRNVGKEIDPKINDHVNEGPERVNKERNTELHSLVKNLPEGDKLIVSFGASLSVNDAAVNGICYLTQNKLLFHSNVLGQLNLACIDLLQVTDISRKDVASHMTIIITTQGKVIYQLRALNNAPKMFAAIQGVWRNAISDELLVFMIDLDQTNPYLDP